MKRIFRAAGAILAAGAVLSACGSSSTASHHSAKLHYGWNGTKLYLPHVGFATATITQLARSDPAYVKQIINSKDWYYSNTFSRYIFVGPYTSGISRQRIRDAKIAAMNARETLILDAAYQKQWPTTLNGFNYDAYGQGPISQASQAALYQSAVAAGHHSMIADVPSEATVVEAPAGKLTPTQMPKSSGAPQQATLGICVPHEFEAVYTARGGYAVPSTALGVSRVDIYFADYGSPSVILSPSKTTGVWSSPTTACADFS